MALSGTGTAPVQLQNVANGTNATDAANVGQVNAVGNAAVKYSLDANGNRTDVVALSGTGTATVQLQNVAAGTNATDAVNVSQLQNANRSSVKYTTDANGNPTNAITLTGDGSGAAVTIGNVAFGQNANDAVNVAQLRNAVNAAASGNVSWA